MTISVSVSKLRGDISKYFDLVSKGNTVLVKNEKRGKDVALITRRNTFNSEDYDMSLKRFAGSISAKDHPEWATKQKIIKWVNDSRKASERSF